MFAKTPLQKVIFNNHPFFIKRDDLLHIDFSGNKGRKFYYFLQQDLSKYKAIISYGSNQSNAMYSLSVLAKMKNIKFIYYTNHLPKLLKQNPIGNLKYALKNGMILKMGNIKDIDIANMLYIKEGGAIKESQYGIKVLADELIDDIKQYNLKNPIVFLPSGTGTTALYLQKYLNIDVWTTPCVGDTTYLQKQFFELEDINHPKILKPFKKFHFGKIYKQNYLIYQKLLQQTNIEFDLLYDPIGWQVLLSNLDRFKNNEIIYIHQGGLKGNESMLLRYQYKCKI